MVNYGSVRWTCTQCLDNGLRDDFSTCKICAPLDYREENPEEKEVVDEGETHHELLRKYERHRAFSWYDFDNPLEAFVDWMLQAWPREYETYCYSHNGGRFDGSFLSKIKKMYEY